MKYRSLFSALLSLPAALVADVTTTCLHPAATAATELLRSALPATLDVRLEQAATGSDDGYTVVREGRCLVVRAAHPRSFLFAAGETQRWLDTTTAPFTRTPATRFRLLNIGNVEVRSVADAARWLAATGCNAVHLNRGDSPALVDLWKSLDVEVYGFLYGCNPLKWNKAACEAFLADHPSARGVDPGRSWEKGVMCPSDPATREFFQAKITSVATAGAFDGMVVTFWDDYGLHCVCSRCRENGLDTFPAQIKTVVGWFETAMSACRKKLIVRTWASGAPHFLGEEWVNAPGYANKADALATWSPVFAAAKLSTVFQTKVYNADCQPNPPFSHLLGEAKRHPEIAEWQITGQTLGFNFLPAPVVDHTARTMRRAVPLVNGNGVCLYAGGYQRKGYDALTDEVNGVNLYVWRQLAWNPNEDVAALCREWATPLYGPATDDVCRALAACEPAVTASFSPLGFGFATESRFAKTVARREDLLRYTNRHQLPEGAALLEPSRANIARLVAEKDKALADVSVAERCLAAARAKTTDASITARLDDFATRLQFLRAHLMCTRAVDGALWRLRYLRALVLKSETDVATMREIEDDFSTLRQWNKKFPEELGSPVPLMLDIKANAVACVEKILGPNWGTKGDEGEKGRGMRGEEGKKGIGS